MLLFYFQCITHQGKGKRERGKEREKEGEREREERREKEREREKEGVPILNEPLKYGPSLFRSPDANVGLESNFLHRISAI